MDLRRKMPIQRRMLIRRRMPGTSLMIAAGTFRMMKRKSSLFMRRKDLTISGTMRAVLRMNGNLRSRIPWVRMPTS